MVRLEIIGCSGAAPEPGGACSCYLVRGGGVAILLDCGPGALPRLATRLAPEAVDAIFLSHMHQDHILDLLPYTRALRRADRGAVGDPTFASPEGTGGESPAPTSGGRRVKLFAPPGGAAVLRALAGVFAKPPEQLAGAPAATVGFSGPALFAEFFDLAEYDPAATIRVGGPFGKLRTGSGQGLAVSFVPMRHVGNAFGMRVTDGAALLAYTGDTGEHPRLDELARDADVLLSEATLRDEDPDSGERHGHLTAAQAGRAAARGGARRLLLTHFSRAELAWRDDLAARAAAEFTGPVVAVRRDDVYAVGDGG